MQWGNDLSTS